ncbi:MAG: UXX-star (seleno)protein family 1 [Desulfotomaculaceae bacterium]
MTCSILLYGKESCPYSVSAKEDFAKRKVPYRYRDVKRDDRALQEMLQLTGGSHEVPVIVDGGLVKIGFGGT